MKNRKKRDLTRLAAETRRRREEFSQNSERWAREEKERVLKKVKERREENERKTELFLPWRRKRSEKRTVGRKSACEVNFLNAAGEEKEGEDEEEEEDFGLVVPRHSEPNARNFVLGQSGEEEREEEEEEEEKPIVCASSPRQNLKSKRFRMKQEVSESKDFAGQEAKLLASIARLDEVVKRTNEINGGAFAKENELRKKETEPKRAQPPQEEHALMRSIARLNLKLELTHETIQIHDKKLFRELLQIS
ncbi:unnamed protein product [Bathycoccus prasinos]